jgi:hypothetical protein
VGGNRKTSSELDKEAAKDMVRAFIRVKASDYFRREMNRVWPQVNDLIDEATANGSKVDMPAMLRELFAGKLELGE